MPWVTNMVATWSPVSVCVEDEAPACETSNAPVVCPYKEAAPEAAWMFSRAQRRDEARKMQEVPTLP